MCFSAFLLRASACVALALPACVSAQQFVETPSGTVSTSLASAEIGVEANSAASTALGSGVQAPRRALTARWLDLTELSESQRYRNNFDTNGARIFAAGQQRSVVAGRLLLDRNGHYFIGFRATSGNYFNWTYADYIGHDFLYYAGRSLNNFTPAETGSFFAAIAADPAAITLNFSDRGWRMNMRDLYLSASPIEQATVEFGSIPIERGYNSEITSFDDDGYMTGERLRLHLAPLHVDEISVTGGYLGDVTKPSILDRGGRLTQNNYMQVAGKTLIGKRLGVSADFTRLNDTSTLREAAYLKLHQRYAPSEVHLDLYQRVNDITLQGLNVRHGSGFAAYANRKAGRFTGDAGYAAVVSGYGAYENSRFLCIVGDSLNGDTYNTGNRVFTHASLRVNPAVSLFGFYTHTVNRDIYTYNRQGFNAGIKFDLKAIINSGKQIL